MWQIFRCIYQMKYPPYIAGGLLNLAGYSSAWITRRPRSVSPEFIKFRGAEQIQRLKRFFTGKPQVAEDLPAHCVAAGSGPSRGGL
jgi:hypothetical protein